MVKIAIFDSGLGSLSIIKPIRRMTKAEIIYFADQKNFPYGKKSKLELSRIITKSVRMLREQFSPDLVVIASNTPSLILGKRFGKNVEYVLPPLKEAIKSSKTKNIAILTTQSVVKSKGLTDYIKKSHVPTDVEIRAINASSLVELVESGKFLDSKSYCNTKIKKFLKNGLEKYNIDSVTLSSTHLPFLLPYLKKQFPNVYFHDPAAQLAKKIAKTKKKSKRNSLRIFTSGNTKKLERNLRKIGITNRVTSLS